MLLQQELEFFDQYGFSSPILIACGIAQLIGGVMLALRRTRNIGAIVVAITFVISAAVLLMAGKIPLVIITLIYALLHNSVAVYSLRS